MAVRAREGVCVEELLQNVIENENLINPKIKIQSGSELGDGYIGINSAVEISGENKVLKLFVKAAPVSPKLRELGLVNETFGNEVFFYNSVYPEFCKFQADRCAEIPFDSVPKCFTASMKNFGEAIVMENLKEQGYVLFDGGEMNKEHIEFVFRKFPKFHAVSFAIKDQEYELYKNLTANFHDVIVESMVKSGIDKALISQSKNVENIFAEGKLIWSKIQNLTETLMNVYMNSNANVDKYSAITQGDCWCNNMMFKYDDNTNKLCPSQMKLIDWQGIRVNYPAIDLSYFFYTVSSKQTMDDLGHYLTVYYNELSKTIRELDSDPDILYPYSIFMEHWKNFCKFGLLMAFLVKKVLLIDKDNFPSLGETAEGGEELGTVFNRELKNAALYKQRIRELLEHFIRNEYI